MYPNMKWKDFKDQEAKNYSKFADGKVFYAFSNDQFTENLKKVGLTTDDALWNLIVKLPLGGFMLKEHVQDYKDLLERLADERTKYLEDEESLLAALIYELGNHEYGYTGDVTDAVESLGLTVEDIPESIMETATVRAQALSS